MRIHCCILRQAHHMDATIKTPCVGICSTALGDPVCRGCKRFNHEVTQWNGYTESEKLNVIKRITDLLQQVLARYIEITNIAKLKTFVSKRRKLVNKLETNSTDAEWAFITIQWLAGKMAEQETLTSVGLILKEEYQHLDPIGLFKAIDEDFYKLCLAYYDANFLRAYQTRQAQLTNTIGEA